MAAGNLKSDQETNRTAVPVVMGGSNEKGRVHRVYFNHTVAVGADVDAGTKVDLCTVPKGARFIGGFWYNDGTWANGAVTIEIGIKAGTPNADPDKFAKTIACAAENFTQIPNTAAIAATAIGYVFLQDEVIQLVTAAAALAAGGIAKGWIDYVLE